MTLCVSGSSPLVIHWLILFTIATFERSLQDNFTESGDYLEVWTAYCDYMRRTIDPDQPGMTSSGYITYNYML